MDGLRKGVWLRSEIIEDDSGAFVVRSMRYEAWMEQTAEGWTRIVGGL